MYKFVRTILIPNLTNTLFSNSYWEMRSLICWKIQHGYILSYPHIVLTISMGIFVCQCGINVRINFS